MADLAAAAGGVRRGYSNWRAWLVWGLEAAMVAILLLLLWEPAITVAELEIAAEHYCGAGGRLAEHGDRGCGQRMGRRRARLPR